jgi:hypothetical protein
LGLGKCGFRAQVEIVLGQVDSAAVFGDERMSMPVFAACLVELQPRATGEPHSGNARMIERGCEFVQTSQTLPAGRNEFVNGNIKNVGSLAQIGLRN